MGIINIDGNLLKNMIIAGANELNRNKQLVDSLNVFPVPDGDTGTNMSLTILAAAKEVEKLNTPNVYDVAKAASNGSLRGARGNSGVIVSQLFRGFAKGLEGKSLADADDLADALLKSQETAYKAIMKPKEGTILTVSKALASKAIELAFDNDDIEHNLKETLKYAFEVLDKTTDMLPELKQAGVVDAGGKGLLCFFEGALSVINFKGEVKIDKDSEQADGVSNNVFAGLKTEDIKFAYCTELFIMLDKENDKLEDNLKNFLSKVGDSIVVVSDENIVKIHVHTNNPGIVLEKSMTYGALDNIKIENMKEQHTSKISFTEETSNSLEEKVIPSEFKDTGFVAVSMGSGLKELFLNLGADIVIEGGQTMNPSTEDILASIEKVNAKNVVVLPNNKNIILAANQAKELCTDKEVIVLPTKTIPQGITSLINFVPSNDVFQSVEDMNSAIENIATGQITYAVRDTALNGYQIKEGDILCMVEGDIRFVSKDLQLGSKQLLESMINEESELVTIYYGEDTSVEMADELSKYILEKYPDCEVEIYSGAQPLYYYLISVE